MSLEDSFMSLLASSELSTPTRPPPVPTVKAVCSVREVSVENKDNTSKASTITAQSTAATLPPIPKLAQNSEFGASIDSATTSLKAELLAAFTRAAEVVDRDSRVRLQLASEAQERRVAALQCEVDELKELSQTYKASAHVKDGVIASLEEQLQAERHRTVDVINKHRVLERELELKGEHAAMQRAAWHYESVLRRKCFRALRREITSKWLQKLQKSCQAKAQQVCLMMSQDYEQKLSALQEKLQREQEQVKMLQNQRGYEAEHTKQAFMRGISALNREAEQLWQQNTLSSTETGCAETDVSDHRQPPEPQPPRIAHASPSRPIQFVPLPQTQLRAASETSLRRGQLSNNYGGFKPSAGALVERHSRP